LIKCLKLIDIFRPLEFPLPGSETPAGHGSAVPLVARNEKIHKYSNEKLEKMVNCL
jgi:hypothetical protein